MIGNANFPQLLGGFQANGATAKAVSVQGAPATEEPGLKTAVGKVTPDFATGPTPAMQASGKALPPFGTSLPLDQTSARNGVDEGGAVSRSQPGAWFEDDAGDAGPELAIQQGFFTMPLAHNATQAAPFTLPSSRVNQPNSETGLRPTEKLEEIALNAGADLRVKADPSAKRSATGISDVTQGLATNPLQPAILNLGESDADPDLPRAAPPAAPASPQAMPQSAAQSPSDAAGPQNSSQTPGSALQVAAAPVSAQPSTSMPMTDTSAALRLAPQLEDAIEQLAETRSAAQANKPELTLRHQEFGAITMRLDTTGGDLRATLSARDPGFVPAIQAALSERAIAMSGEAANAGRNNDQTGSNSQSQSNSQSGTSSGSQGHSQGNGHGHGHGQGWNSGTAYGSSTGSGQGTSQPYTGQTEGRDEESGLDAGSRRMGRGDGSEGDGEIFA
ncbi:hypothetical protein EH31_14600 [Erythrobacter longus]|uniref:Uncharacterized protein n=1 Tax=Erythrobacter longus TaxID=1044 RepID=A0A074M779_ERYLO|nr:hypothetical protein EH31_14600 [Erythrobacter longus]